MQCREMSAVVACLLVGGVPNRSIVAHYEYGMSASGLTDLVATRYTEADGFTVITLGAGETVSPGACPVAGPDIEWEKMCDVQGDGTVVEFWHRIVTVFAPDNTPTVTVVPVALDKVTPYAPTGVVSACDEDCDVIAPVGVVATWG